MIGLFALAASTAAIHGADRRKPLAGQRSQLKEDLIAAKRVEAKPPGFLSGAYAAAGVATTATWGNIVRTTIRSNQPMGAMMPSVQHQIFARASVLSAVPVIVSCYATLASASKDSWESLSSNTCRRLNLALAAAGVGGALWVGFAPTLTQIPGSNPVASHQAYKGAARAAMIASYGSAAALSAAASARSLPEDVRNAPLSWPGRVADGVAKSLVSLGPKDSDNPVNVKYALLSTSFLLLTAVQLGSFPLAVVPSWTGRRLSRHFPAWTLLAAASSFNLKEAVENGKSLPIRPIAPSLTASPVWARSTSPPRLGPPFSTRHSGPLQDCLDGACRPARGGHHDRPHASPRQGEELPFLV